MIATILAVIVLILLMLLLPIPRRGKTHVYKAADGYRWRAVANNGRIVADGGEAYTLPLEVHKAAAKFGPRKFHVTKDAM